MIFRRQDKSTAAKSAYHALDFEDTMPDCRWLESLVGVESTHPLTWLPRRVKAITQPWRERAVERLDQAVPPTVNPSILNVG